MELILAVFVLVCVFSIGFLVGAKHEIKKNEVIKIKKPRKVK